MHGFHLVKGFVQATAGRFGYQVERKYELGEFRLDLLEVLVGIVSPTDRPFFFIQIGANDGEANDPIAKMVHRDNWNGILLEPQPAVFEKLVRNYDGSKGLIFENAALADSDGPTPFWSVPGRTGASSFDKRVLRRAGVREDEIVETLVNSISANTLIAKYHVSYVDLLQVDAEGFDFGIIKLFLEAGVRPLIINYEHLHLSTADRSACVKFLGDRGYKMLQAGPERIDTIAFLVNRTV